MAFLNGRIEVASTPWSAAAWRRFGPLRLGVAFQEHSNYDGPWHLTSDQSAARSAHSKELNLYGIASKAELMHSLYVFSEACNRSRALVQKIFIFSEALAFGSLLCWTAT